MPFCAVISEYDPFHAGHAYLLKKAGELTGLPMLSLMSGCFLQRGTPAVQNKYVRAEAALMGGSDAVLELPAVFATGSARDFAEGAVRLLKRTELVTHLAFGVESSDTGLLEKAAAVLSHEPEPYPAVLRRRIKEGLSYPAASQEALSACLAEDRKQLSDLLQKPNHILAVEYLRAILLFAPDIKPVPVLRSDNGFTSRTPRGRFVSATAIREMAAREEDFLPYVPDTLKSFYREHPLISDPEERLTAAFNQALLQLKYGNKDPDISDLSPALLMRIRRMPLPLSYQEILEHLKEKNETRTRVARALIHLLLGITGDTMQKVRREGIHYVNLLGLRRSASSQLNSLSCDVALISKKADYHPEGFNKTLWDIDCFASHFYSLLMQEEAASSTELTSTPIIL